MGSQARQPELFLMGSWAVKSTTVSSVKKIHKIMKRLMIMASVQHSYGSGKL
jgi:hypothetical protein